MNPEESNILVAIRCRPLNQKEVQNEDLDIVRVEDNLIIILDPIQMEYEAENKKMLEVYHRSKEQRYAFDKVFREESQDDIFEQTCKQLIKPVMNGYNATVFAYGPTGTGKTYTMLGNQETMGISVLTIRDMFEFIKRDLDNEYIVMISYVEIYNEAIRDLLIQQSQYLELRDDPIKGVTIAGVTEYKAISVQQVMNLLLQGNRRRTTEATNANLTSSRSHAVFQINVTQRSKVKNTEMESMNGKLSLIDLAGSERGTVTENRGLRLREGAKINRSLLALANCINALGDKSKKGFFVPYRDSKLTRLLKDSLGGNCRTVMIANISPASSQFEETINTLKYANRAKNIKTKQLPNKKLVAMHIAEYKNIISDLRSEIESLKLRLNEKQFDDNEDESITINNYINKNGKPEQEELKSIQEEIFENFQERIQLRRALMEIEEQNAMNFLEIKKRQSEILQWKKSGEKNMPEDIRQGLKSIQTLKTSTEKNMIKKELMGLQLVENINNAKKIRESIPKRIQSKEKRDYLELEIKNHVLELQNVELEINLQIQEKTINDLKMIVENQKKLINDTQDEEKYFEETDIEYIDDLLEDPEFQQEQDDDDLEDLGELDQFKEFIKKEELKQNSPNQFKQRDKSAPRKQFNKQELSIQEDYDEISQSQSKPKVRDQSRNKRDGGGSAIQNKVLPPKDKQLQFQQQIKPANIKPPKDISVLNLQGRNLSIGNSQQRGNSKAKK
ncbi:unnamed protein product (macronuclear) [Paramecium tetraurelia]|uniref:Kinesin-like protein n=1 Tax=Paramecium tetraurelia TaxID=5888 RepID=A0BI43_PARTE|nr:uncharacterized protein GSPATT00029246001 [Paramecium tetraurelia]CAK58210.1 unnamed protein product [Paramecium tetraurelia]|eukprot:XP_001425608.1 hypothetical protein (macronuclear) [Paramecium tetraurelia strain d4-2]